MSLMRSVHDWDPSDSDGAVPQAAIAEAQKRDEEDHHEKAYMTVSQVSRPSLSPFSLFQSRQPLTSSPSSLVSFSQAANEKAAGFKPVPS